MEQNLRRRLTFTCNNQALAATLDEAPGIAGLLIISGGNEIRIGSHRGMAKLAADIARHGISVFRFDRRGIGDSEGSNGNFDSSGPDIDAALQAFRAHCPHIQRVYAFGNCDAAAALLLHKPKGLAGQILSNPWTIEVVDDLPPPAAIRAHYASSLSDPKVWIRLITGGINVRKLFEGLKKIAKPQAQGATSLVQRVADGLDAQREPITIILANRDNTAIAFAEAWQSKAFAAARANPRIKIKELDSASHSFASDGDYSFLRTTILEAVSLG